MSCGIIGSFCHKLIFCETCHCKCTSSCLDRVVVGMVESGKENQVTALAAHAASLRNLLTAPHPVHEDIAVKTISRRQFKNCDLSQKNMQAELGLLKLAIINFRAIQQEHAFSDEETLVRLTFAQKMANVDLETHFEDRDPICTMDHQELDRQVHNVQTFGSHAVTIWEIAKGTINMDHLPKLKSQILNGMPTEINKEFFGELEFRVQKFFFEQAKKLARFLPDELRDRQAFWVKPNDHLPPIHELDDCKENDPHPPQADDQAIEIIVTPTVEELMDKAREVNS